MYSACGGDYEDPDRHFVGEEPQDLENCPHTDEVRWNPLRGQFECLRCREHLDIPELTNWDQDVAVQL